MSSDALPARPDLDQPRRQAKELRDADIEARDSTWDSTPLEWAMVGSGMRLGHHPDPDWGAAVRTLIEADASTEGIVLPRRHEASQPGGRQPAALLRDPRSPRLLRDPRSP